MILYMTRNIRFHGDCWGLHTLDVEPEQSENGNWASPCADLYEGRMSSKDAAAFQSEFPLKPGGGPLKVELRVVEP
jgi:hypothetical protein